MVTDKLGNMFDLDFSNLDIDKSIPTISISAILSYLETPFDQKGVATKTYERHYNNPSSEYYHKNVDEIISMWEAKGSTSRHYGSLLDDYIGNILTGNDRTLDLYKLDNNFDNDERLQNLAKSFDHFYSLLCKSGDTIFVDREKTVYYPVKVNNPSTGEAVDYYIKGRFDALFYNKRTNKWIIIDWKSSGSIDKTPDKWTKNLLGPMSKYPALNWYTYTTQLYFYKKTLVERYLPKGTSLDDVVVMVVNLPGKIIEGLNVDYATHKAAYNFDDNLLDQVYKFAVQKKLLELEINKEENKEEQLIQEQSDNLEDIF